MFHDARFYIQGHLAGVSQSEWEAIPDVGDYSLKYKQSKRREVFTPMPDHVIEGARNDTAVRILFCLFFGGRLVFFDVGKAKLQQ